MAKEKKPMKYQPDEFNPKGYFNKSFWMVPRSIAALKELSNTAKLVYPILTTLAGDRGYARVGKAYIGSAINASERTVARAIDELEAVKLIRPLRRGHGLVNQYYFLRSPLIGNADEGEVLTNDYRMSYLPDLVCARTWICELTNPTEEEMLEILPKPRWHYNKKQYKRFAREFFRTSLNDEDMPDYNDYF